jgi:hypothetical protein
MKGFRDEFYMLLMLLVGVLHALTLMVPGIIGMILGAGL